MDVQNMFNVMMNIDDSINETKTQSKKRQYDEDDDDDIDYNILDDDPKDEDYNPQSDKQLGKRSKMNNGTSHRRGPPPKIPKLISNGIRYEDNGTIMYKITSKPVPMTIKINLGSSIRNFTVEYSNTIIAKEPIQIQIDVPNYIKPITVDIKEPTMMNILNTIHSVYNRLLSKDEQKHIIMGKKNCKYRLHHLLGNRIYYAGLDYIKGSIYKLKLKTEKDELS